jgi:two-component system, LuxR family, response regulator DctR
MATGSKVNIVVVEDDPAMNLALTRLLKAAGFRAVAFDSAEGLLDDPAAIASATCLILDVHLSGISGFELRQQLQDKGTDPPTVFITADENPRLPWDRFAAATLLTKPFSSYRLLATLHQALDRVNSGAKEL